MSKTIEKEDKCIFDSVITENYAIYHGDCMEVIGRLPSESIHISIYSPPFCGLFHYSSSERDMSNCRSYEEFFENYEFLVRELTRVTMPGRMNGVHCMDVPSNGANLGGNQTDFPGDIIRLYQSLGWSYSHRYCIWKEPLAVRNRTMQKALAHRQVVEDSTLCENAGADYLLMFRHKGENQVPVAHPEGLMGYAGEKAIPGELLRYKGWKGKQTENKYSHWIWRQYASSFWDDVRLDRVLKYKTARDSEDEKHIHPLQLDVVERCVILYTNPGETVLTPFMGVGSEVAGAVMNGRKGIGVELKKTYYNQAVKNLRMVEETANSPNEDGNLLSFMDEDRDEDENKEEE